MIKLSKREEKVLLNLLDTMTDPRPELHIDKYLVATYQKHFMNIWKKLYFEINGHD